MKPTRTIAPLAATLALLSCSSGTHAPPTGAALVPPASFMRSASGVASDGKIKHIVIIIQENRSFDNLFQGYPGANTQPSGLNSKGQTITLAPVSLGTQYLIGHSSFDFFNACDGNPKGQNCKMDGFDKESQTGGPPNGQYVYVPHAESQPYFDMAHQFVVADNTFSSQLDESFVAHQYLIAGQASSAVDIPTLRWGCDARAPSDEVTTLLQDRQIGPMESPCLDNQTLGDELDAAGSPWRFYAPKLSLDGGWWSGYQAIHHIRYGPDWRNVKSPQTRFFTDVKAGKLAAVTWITPICINSDHPDCGSKHGPDWVANLVNAVGKSTFWNSTAIFVVWDDWGGLYDHVPPPFADYDGLGFRIPLIVMSPYAKKNYVSHVQYETASILRFAEDNFGLAQLAASDARATSPAADCFDFTQRPRPFIPIKSNVDTSFFFRQPNDGRPPDDG